LANLSETRGSSKQNYIRLRLDNLADFLQNNYTHFLQHVTPLYLRYFFQNNKKKKICKFIKCLCDKNVQNFKEFFSIGQNLFLDYFVKTFS